MKGLLFEHLFRDNYYIPKKCIVYNQRSGITYYQYFRSSLQSLQRYGISEIHITGVWALIPRCREKIFMMVDLITNIASELLHVIAFVTGLAIILSKRTCFFKSNSYHLKQNKQYSNISWNIVMVKCFCSSALCFNNFTSKVCKRRPLKYYRLPREESIQSEYRNIFRTDGINWNKGHICLAHWSLGGRKSINDLPDIPIPADQLQKIQEKYKAAKTVLEKYKTLSQKLHLRYKNAKRKSEIASQMSKDGQNLVKRTPVIRECTLVPPPRKKTPSKKQYPKKAGQFI